MYLYYHYDCISIYIYYCLYNIYYEYIYKCTYIFSIVNILIYHDQLFY